MRMEITKEKIRIIPETDLDRAYLDDTIGVKRKPVLLRKSRCEENDFILETISQEKERKTIPVKSNSKELNDCGTIGEQFEGTVKSYNADRAFGFIRISSIPGDIFFHITDIHGEIKPKKDDRVMFSLIDSDTGYKGKNVVIIKGEHNY